MRRFSRVGAVALCLAVVAGSTVIAKTTRFKLDYLFPGVDEFGLLDDDLGAEGVVRVTYNDRSDRLRLVGRAKVDNDSNRLQVYNDTGVLDDFDGDVVRDRYRVTKRGAATYNGVVRDVESID